MRLQPRKETKNMAAEVGKAFPEFSLLNQDGEMVTLGDFVGKWLVVYVYPKDDTPGCTIQGKSFTATKQEFDDANIAVVGVSADDVESHKNFCNKFSFTIDLWPIRITNCSTPPVSARVNTRARCTGTALRL